MKFYTVLANFDMASSSEREVKTFLKQENANKFAEEKWKEFLDCIPRGGALDEEFSDYKEQDELLYFYGTSEDGENFATISVFEDTFADEEQEKKENDFVYLCNECDELYEDETEVCDRCPSESIRVVSRGDMGMF
ncbi:hypothetical protein [Viridibacillus arvi]|uniref:hypothetical protein n=1 Tax=Viridibacillus arvi TaxID=263475 RepID=UPI0034CE1AA2